MSLGRLLSTGRSLVGVRSAGGRYRMSDPRTLPKFGSSKNPFAARENARVEAAADPQPLLSASVEPLADGAGTASKATAPSPLIGECAIPATKKPAALRLAFRAWLQRVHAWLGAPAKLARRLKNARKTGQPPIQCELSLERVTVVRNDLSDSDVEIITSKTTRPTTRDESGSAEKAAPAAVPTAEQEMMSAGKETVRQTATN
jgi:hypothetical protein